MIPNFDIGYGPIQSKQILLEALRTNTATLTLSSDGDIIFKPSGDTDNYFTFSTVANIPTITATGSYLRIGTAGTSGHGLTENDLLVSGVLEVDGNSFFDNGLILANGAAFDTANTNGAYFDIRARDTGIGMVIIANLISAADPYFQIGRDDVNAGGLTGQPHNTVCDVLVIQAGAGTENESAGFGAGILVKLGNAASEVEERASIDVVLTTATNGSEAAKLDINLMNAGAMAPSMSIIPAGATGAILFSSGGIAFQASNDTDDYLSFVTTAGRPGLIANGSYMVLGADGTPGSATTDGDVYVKQALEVDGTAYFHATTAISTTGVITLTAGNGLKLADDIPLNIGSSSDGSFEWDTSDSNANNLRLALSPGGATNTPVFSIQTATSINELGLWDGVTQPIVAVIDKAEKYASDTAMTAAGAGATMTLANEFTNSVVGDIVRVTGGTNATAGWYWITTVTDASNIVLDRNWCTGAVTDGVAILYHSFTMLSAEGICTRITDGAPSDASVEIDRDGWIILDVGQANGRLYWRANNAWHYVDATAGLSLPKEERIDPTGHEFQIGDEVKLIVDRINEDGSFHAIPHYRYSM